MTDLVLTLMVLATGALLWGAWAMRARDRKRAVLMLVAALVVLFNVVMWAGIPTNPG